MVELDPHEILSLNLSLKSSIKDILKTPLAFSKTPKELDYSNYTLQTNFITCINWLDKSQLPPEL